jgi:hypothetical protein
MLCMASSACEEKAPSGKLSDSDTDGDGWPDLEEAACHTDPTNPTSIPLDSDRDLLCDAVDDDDDDDGWSDQDEIDCRTDPNDALSQPEDPDANGVCNPWGGYPPGNAWYGLGTSEPAPWSVFAMASTGGSGISGVPGEAGEMPSLATDSAGRVVVAWMQSRCIHEAGPTGCTYRSAVYLRRFSGSAWAPLGDSTQPGGLSGIDIQCGLPKVAIGPDNEPVVAWSCYRDPDSASIHVQRFRSGEWQVLAGFGNELGLLDPSEFHGHLDIAVDAAGSVWLVWIESGIRVYAKLYDGSTWQDVAGSATGAGIGEAASGAFFPDVALYPDGTPAIAWVAQDAPGPGHYALSRLRAGAWEPVPAPTAADSRGYGLGRPISIATRGDGSLVAAWRDAPAEHDALYVAAWDDVTWSEISGSATGAGLGPAPADISLVIDGTDSPWVAWIEEASVVHNWLHVHRATGSGWVDTATSAPFAAGDVGVAGLSLLADDTPVVVWAGSYNRGPLFAAQYSSDGWVSVGDTRTGHGLGNDEIIAVDLVADAQAPLSVTWIEVTDFTDPIATLKHLVWTPGVWAPRPGSLDASGGVGSAVPYWSPAPLFCSSTAEIVTRDPNGWVRYRHDGTTWQASSFSAHDGYFAVDALGRVTIVWWEAEALRAMRVDGSTSEDLGSPSAAAVLPASGYQHDWSMVAIDPDGEPVVAWVVAAESEAFRTGEVLLVRRMAGTWQEVDNSATFPGLTDGTGQARWPRVVVGGDNEPIVVWQQTDGYDLWAGSEVRLVRHGPLGWSGLGGSALAAGISNNPGGSFLPIVALDTHDNPIVAWGDSSSGSFEVYLRHWFHGQWLEHWGSAVGGGVSNSAAQSWPMDLFADARRICVAYTEAGDPTPLMLRCSDL